MASKFRNLVAWQRAMALVTTIYDVTRTFPREEIFGLTAQVRRAANSIPSNIAEGDGRRGDADQRRFFITARGSLLEVETQIEIALRLQYVPQETATEVFARIEGVAKPLNGLIKSLPPPAASRQPRAI
jgi:four helix bundle protein